MDPVRHHLPVVGPPFGCCSPEERLPRVALRNPFSQQIGPELLSDVAANRVTLVSMDTTLALLEVNGIGREVPMHHRTAPQVEVQPLLTDRSRGQYERPERRVEGDRHGAYPGLTALVERLIAKATAKRVRMR